MTALQEVLEHRGLLGGGLKDNQHRNHGCRRPGAGRPKGSRNKASIDFEKRLAEKSEALNAIMDGAFEGDSHALLMSIYKDQALPLDVRMEAAKAAIAYEKPRLSAVDMKATVSSQEEFINSYVPKRQGVSDEKRH